MVSCTKYDLKIKKKLNSKFARHASKRSGDVLILDSKKANTAKTLNAHNIIFDRIHIVENDSSTFTWLRSEVPDCHIKYGQIEDHVERISKNYHITSAYLDFCCTIGTLNGNQCPMQCISDVLRITTTDRFTLACTFSTRFKLMKRIAPSSAYTRDVYLDKFLLPCINNCNFQIMQTYCVSYKGRSNMVWYMFELERNTKKMSKMPIVKLDGLYISYKNSI